MTRVLVPVEVLDGKTVSPGLMTLLGTVDVTVLGYHVLPEQTPADQARLQYEERATAALEDLSDEFQSAGGAADHRLVFTHDREQTIKRIADEIRADAFAISGMTGTVDNLLVSLSGALNDDRILPFVTELVGDRDIAVTLFLASDDTGADRLKAAAEELRAAGLTARTEHAMDGSPFDALMDAVPGHDAIVMAEQAPSFRSLFFGDEADRVASASVGPVLVVRHEQETDE
ncbi:universal stress protein [Haloarcula sp. S1AR25-5A]|uniref:Universal stress protein n=1 Tax=Haloarcula terrestris TaxID=2950533 RepID=A0AAE4JG19_9EURY|nr:universal stress protein [Haloarcula terrestris]MDS0220837.1 universal stress protein [Haloarcula terrestris]